MLSEKAPKIRWQDKVPDIEVLTRAWMQSMHTLLKLVQLRWTGYATRISDERLPKKVFYGELQVGKRTQGGQMKRYKDTLKSLPKEFKHTIRVLGTECTGSSKVALPYRKGSR